ncbi:hypothetical protein ACJX0J_023520, partial [Zea mays]
MSRLTSKWHKKINEGGEMPSIEIIKSGRKKIHYFEIFFFLVIVVRVDIKEIWDKENQFSRDILLMVEENLDIKKVWDEENQFSRDEEKSLFRDVDIKEIWDEENQFSRDRGGQTSLSGFDFFIKKRDPWQNYDISNLQCYGYDNMIDD